MTAPADIDGLSLAALKALVVQLLSKVAEQEQLIADLREENARLKGLNGRPRIKPSGMENTGETKPPGKRGKQRRRGKITPRVAVEDRVIKARVPPARASKGTRPTGARRGAACRGGARPAGALDHAGWDHGIGCFATRRGRAFRTGTASFRAGATPSGPSHRAAAGGATAGIGVSISKRQVMRLLIAGQDGFLTEARDVLRVGLETAAWISVDDTGARHAGKNGFCTQIGNDDFTWFGTRPSKSRLNFLDLLRAGHTDYVINQAALDYMRGRALAGPVINQLAAPRQMRFTDHAAWQTHLDRLGISALQVTPDPVCIATEGALWAASRRTDCCAIW